MDISSFRSKYPQYNSLSDTELGDKLYNKFYAGKVDREAFDNHFNPPDTSIGGAIRHGVSNLFGDVGASISETGEEIGGKATAGKWLEAEGARLAPKNYKPAEPFKDSGQKAGPLSRMLFGEDKKNYDVTLSELPRAMAEQVAPIGFNLATAGAGSVPQYYGKLKRQAEADAGGKPLGMLDQAKVAGKTAALTGIGMIPGAKIRAPLAQTGLRGAVEAAKRPLQVGAGAGAQSAAAAGIQGQDPIPAFMTGAATGGTLAGVRTPGNVYKAAKYHEFSDPTANAAVANRLEAHGANPKLGKSKADFTAMKATATDIKRDVQAEILNARSTHGLNQNMEKIVARARLLQPLSKDDVAQIARLNNKPLTDIISQARTYSLLSQKGQMAHGKYKGGLSNVFDRFVSGNPIWAAAKAGALAGGTGAGAVALGAGMSGLNAAGAGGLAGAAIAKGAPILAGLYGGLRVIDRETGNRNPASSFVKKFSDQGKTRPGRPMTPLQLQQASSKNLAALNKAIKASNAKQKPQPQAPGVAPGGSRPNVQGLLANAAAAGAKYHGKTLKQIADEATDDAVKSGKLRVPPVRYWKGVYDRRMRFEKMWQSLENSHNLAGAPDAWVISQVKDLVAHTSRRAHAQAALDDIKHNVSPQTAAAIDSIFTKSALKTIWNK